MIYAPDPSQPHPYPPTIPDGLASPPPIVLPDDPPNPAHTKIGPLGQVMKTAGAAAAAKKKAKGKPSSVPMLHGSSNGNGSGPSQALDGHVGAGLAGGKVGGKAPPSPSKGSKKVNPTLPPIVMASA